MIEAALKRGIEMLELGINGASISLQNDERTALLIAAKFFADILQGARNAAIDKGQP